MAMNKNVLLLGSVLLIILAVALVSLLSRTSSTSDGTDVRARAAVTKNLQLNGTVTSLDETNGTLVVEGAYLADESRAGDPQNLGSWTVTAPFEFNFSSVSAGQQVTIGIDAKTFLVQSHTVTALSIVPLR